MVENTTPTLDELVDRNHTTVKEYFEDSYRFESSGTVLDSVTAPEGLSKDAD